MPGKRTNYEHKQRFLRELLTVYRRVIAGMEHIDREEMTRRVCASSYSRFWVTEDRATRVITKMINSWGHCPVKRGASRDMYEEIYGRTIDLLQKHPKMEIAQAVTEVVNSPSPRLYLSPRKAYEKINEAKRLCSEYRRPRT